MEIKKTAETEVAKGAGVDADSNGPGMAEVGQSLVWASVVLVECAAGQDLLTVGIQLGIVDDPTDETAKIRVLGIKLASVIVALGLKIT